jgi:putative MATE family efflux protein
MSIRDTSSSQLGVLPISKLLVKQAVPASIGILVMSLNIMVDSIFVGNWIGPNAIAAINIVLPVSFFIAAIGMAIGIGGSSVISRALGAKDKKTALQTFGNQIALTLLITVPLVFFGLSYADSLIGAFGGRGELFEFSKVYYTIVLYGVPVLAFCMMGNTVIRAEGKPKFAMYSMLIPSVFNLLLDYVFINLMGLGMHGAAWATTGSYCLSFIYVFWFFTSNYTELKLNFSHFILRLKLLKEIVALGSVTFARQVSISLTYLVLNNILFQFGGEHSVVVYAIVSRLLMFALFPVYGITQGFLPIAGYNYGAKLNGRVKKSINTAILFSSLLALLVFTLLMVFPEFITSVFTSDPMVIAQAPRAMRMVFLATPIISVQLIGAAYFQAVGKTIPALLLTLSRQALFLIPLIFVLSEIYGEFGVWVSFPISDLLSTLVTAYFLNKEVRLNLKQPTNAL